MIDIFKNIKKYSDYIFYSTKSKLKSEVSRSYLNTLWWILNPLCHMLIYIFIVEIVFKSKEQYFPIFVLIGITLWNYFSKMLTSSIKLITNNKSIITKAYIPKYILLIINSLNLLFKMLISVLIIAILMIFFKIQISINILMFIPIITVLYVITFGLSLILSHLGVFMDDLTNIVDLLLKFIYYFSGIFYSIITRIPKPFNDILLNFNPVAFLINETRNVLIFKTPCNYLNLLIWFIIGIIISIIGLKIVKKHENTYVKVMQ